MTHTNPTTSKLVAPDEIDSDLFRMISRHNELFERAAGEYCPDDVITEMCALEKRIAVRPAHTRIGLIGKQMVVDRAEFGAEAMEMVSTILADDLERVG